MGRCYGKYRWRSFSMAGKESANVPFAITVCWGLIAILIANVTRECHPDVAAVCGVMTVAEFAALVSARTRV